jgi:branched-chain amino acid transport system substrate-binding protein
LVNGEEFRIARTVALLSVLVLALVACGGGSGTSSVAPGRCPPGGVALGFFGALTGENAQLGINIRNGVQLAIDQYNAGNPVCAVQLVAFDSQGSPDQAPALALQAVQNQQLVAIVGPTFSGESKVANPIFNEVGMPIVTASATNTALADNGWEIFHRVIGDDLAQGQAIAGYITDTLRPEKVAVVDDKTEYGKGLADIVRQELGNRVGFNDAIDQTAQDYSSTVNGVKSSGANVIFYGGLYAEAGRLLKQLRDAGITATFISGDGARDPGLIAAAGRAAAEGALMTCPCAPLEQARGGEQFLNGYKTTFGVDPGTYSAEGYDAANLLLEAIKAGNIARTSINKFLEIVEYQGITKLITFDRKGEVTGEQIFLYKVMDGAITSVGPIA